MSNKPHWSFLLKQDNTGVHDEISPLLAPSLGLKKGDAERKLGWNDLYGTEDEWFRFKILYFFT